MRTDCGLYKCTTGTICSTCLWYFCRRPVQPDWWRRLAMNLNALFDERLADTDLMITERNAGVDSQLRSWHANRTLSGNRARPGAAERFLAVYPKLVRWFLTLAVLPFVLLILLFIIQQKNRDAYVRSCRSSSITFRSWSNTQLERYARWKFSGYSDVMPCHVTP